MRGSFRERSICLVLGATTVLITPMIAAPAACPTTISSLSRTFSGAGAPSWTVNVPGSSTTNNIANLTTPGTTGCFATDLTFSAFALSSTDTGTLDSPLPTAAGTYLAQSPNPDTLLFSTLQGAGTGADGAQDDGSDNLKVDTTETLAATLSYGVSNSKSTGIYSVAITLNGITVQTGGSGTITIDTCSHGATVITGSITSAGACTTAGGAGSVFTTSNAVTLMQGQTQTVSLSLASTHPTFVDVTEVLNLACAACGTTETGILSFSNQFSESPEPSTFILLGCALIALAVIARRTNRVHP
ncbi:MAG TPA: hypothetical protein VK752_25205 [Bryobacteraceae bacterium]|jgi:hypothetical protein|nr:hypothetical protein [Bryobacteraceae bacterium]